MNFTFKKLSNNDVVDLPTYVSKYVHSNENINIYVGCDSQTRGRYTKFGLVIVLHKGNSGGHVLYTTLSVDRIRDRFERLWKEVELSISIANVLNDAGITIKYIDLDLNPDPKWGSNNVLRAAMGYVESLGYVPRCKPFAVSASYAADKICK
jgi:predicted RNase H-related nuclease YkuK (DUF458 family)